MPSDDRGPMWCRWTLRLAGLYNILWGTWVIVRPRDLFEWTGIPAPTYLGIWQCVGMIVGVYGVGYLAASRAPLRHWPVVLVGFLGKVFGPLGFLWTQWTIPAGEPGYLPWSWGIVNVFNDLVWWIPFAGILYSSFRFHAQPAAAPRLSLDEAIQRFRDQQGHSLADLSNQQNRLVLFLRHSGCTFCREAMADVAQQREAIERLGTKLAIVHLTSTENALAFAAKYGLQDVPQFSDPDAQLYQAFGLSRGSVRQLFGSGVWWRGFSAAILNGHGLGMMEGDGFQMPGAFLLRDGQVVKAFRHPTAAERPDYVALSRPPEAMASPL